MYIKLTPKVHSSNDSYYQYFIGEVKKVLDGTVTTVNGLNSTYVDIDNSIISGTAPSAGIYSNFSISGYTLTFNKKYYHQATGFTPSVDVRHDYHTSYGPGWRMYRLGGTPNGTSTENQQPPGYDELRGWTGTSAGSSNSSCYSTYTRDSTNYLMDVHIIYRDDMFMYKENRSRNALDPVTHVSTNVNQHGTQVFMINDLEYQEGMDDVFYTQYSKYCPSVCTTIVWGFYGLWNDLIDPYTLGTWITTNDVQFFCGKTSYPTASGQFKNHSYNQGYNGQHTTSNPVYRPLYDNDDAMNIRQPSIYPPMHRSIPPYVGADGAKGYQMIPLQYDANAQSSKYLTEDDADVRYGALMNIYRTTNNITKYDGQSFEKDGVTYRTFRMHGCGDNNVNKAAAGACYVIPE